MKEVLIAKNISHENPGLIQLVLDAFQIPFKLIDLSKGESIPDLMNYSAFILLGGPNSANDNKEGMQQELAAVKICLHNAIPFLGICLGMQVLAKAAGGKVIKSPVKEIGFLDSADKPYEITLTEEGASDKLFSSLESPFRVFQLHGETVEIPDNIKLLGRGRHCPNQVIKVGPSAYGIQCHFELTQEMLKEWCAEDSDLRKKSQENLFNEFIRFEAEYVSVGRQLIENFISLAGLAAIK